MAKTEFVMGVKCKKCGDFFTSVELEDHTLCQNCGAKIIATRFCNNKVIFDKYGEEAIIKVTHKLFGIINEYELIEN